MARDEGIGRDTVRAVEIYEYAVGEGNVNAMTSFAFFLCNGTEGAQKDIQKAVQLFEKAAEAGKENAMNELGFI